ncbi:ATP-binding protein [Prevotella sp. AGR2160]|uniref:ATP-binding protein n=1 Tax=Prevotella sp. AGR2160 TaxID=1280674 RepID=UPI002934A3EF|nr:ATP-binding protein [Prevotella sp. AGR2160]
MGITVETANGMSADEMMGKIIKGFTIRALLQNSGLIRQDGTLTVACLELFGKNPQRWLPGITIKGVCMPGTSIASTTFLDKLDSPDTNGNLLHQYEQIMAFFTRNLHRRQTEEEFNSIGSLEIPYSSLSELTVNALIHRSLTRQSPIRVFIFDDRVEIHSPGTLPGGLSVDEIKQGTSLPRNMLLFNNAIFLLPYTGIGSGIVRALQDDDHIEFLNDEGRQEFIVTLKRNNSDTTGSNSQEGNSVREAPKSVRVALISNSQREKSNSQNIKSNSLSNSQQSESNSQELSTKEREVIAFCSVPRTSREILEHLNIGYQTKNIKRYITDLVNRGLLLMSNPSNPKDKKQKYRKA